MTAPMLRAVSINRAQRIESAWIRVGVGLVAYLVAWWLVGLWSVDWTLPAARRLDREWGLSVRQWFSVINGFCTIHIPMIAATLFGRKFIDRQSFAGLGLHCSDSQKGAAGLPARIGLAMLAVAIAILLVTGGLRLLNGVELEASPSRSWAALLIYAVHHAVVAFAEGVLMLGYIIANLRLVTGPVRAALWSAAVFAIAHGLNPNITVLGGLNLFLFGLALALAVAAKRDLWAPMAAHWIWNVLQGPILGYSVSGKDQPSLFRAALSGSDWVTGGRFGLEGSLMTTMVLLGAVVVVGWTWRARLVGTTGLLPTERPQSDGKSQDPPAGHHQELDPE